MFKILYAPIIVVLSVTVLFGMHLGKNNPVGPMNDDFDKTNKYCDIFDEQIDRLDDRGCPQFILNDLLDQKVAVVEAASRMNIEKGNLPFIPVIPESQLSFYRQVEMVYKDRGVGYMTLDPSTVSNVVRVPGRPYYVFDVDDGKGRIGVTPNEADRWIKLQFRSALTTEEMIALCTHTEVLKDHDVSAPASRVGTDDDRAPRFYVDDRGVPCLDWCFIMSASRKMGTPSCKREEYGK